MIGIDFETHIVLFSFCYSSAYLFFIRSFKLSIKAKSESFTFKFVVTGSSPGRVTVSSKIVPSSIGRENTVFKKEITFG